MPDNWKHRSENMRCKTCMWFVPKMAQNDPRDPGEFDRPTFDLGRCRRHAPTLAGWPAVFVNDRCGDHKLDENKLQPELDLGPGKICPKRPASPKVIWANDPNLVEAIDLLAAELLKAKHYTCIYERIVATGYCDDCPISEAMSGWSDMSKLFCRKVKYYSKWESPCPQ